ncbi:TPA: TMEM165/GDT1 family protein [Legionella pneumophila]
MEALIVSLGVITLAEIGDKTQLLAFLLAAQFKKPLPIILGILTATLINHSLAGLIGIWITTLLKPNVLRWILGISFILMAIWTLIPDEIEQDEKKISKYLGVIGATFITFFLSETGDKTQIATIALAAHYSSPILVIAGSTLGMLLADLPAVYFGNLFSHKIPMKIIHAVAACAFLIIGLITILF